MFLLRQTLGLLLILYFELFMPLGCKATLVNDSETITSQTSQQTTVFWQNTYPTISPSSSISYSDPYLFYSTITFGIIILGTAVLMIIKACFRKSVTNHRCCSHECSGPILSRFRLSLVPTDAILINATESVDKPPDYETAIRINVEGSKNYRSISDKIHFYSESPPPSYGSIETTSIKVSNEKE